MSNENHPLSGLVDALENILKNMVFNHYVKLSSNQEVDPIMTQFLSSQVKLSHSYGNSAQPTVLAWYRATRSFNK